MVPHELLGHEGAQVVVGQELDRVQLVRGAEPVEEVQERHARAQRGGLRDERQVVGLLHGCRCEQGEPRLAGRHHVRVVAEDRQALRRERPGGDVQHRRRQLAGDLVHVRDHQQQALRRGECRGERAALERAVQRAGGSALALHLDHRGHAAPDVGAALARPLVGQLGHRRGRRDREDAADLVQAGRRRETAASFPSTVARISAALGEHVDGVHRALLEAGPAAGTAVVVEPVAVPGPSLITASSGQAPRQPSHSKQLPHDRQRPASYTASSAERPPTTSSKPATRSRARAPAARGERSLRSTRDAACRTSRRRASAGSWPRRCGARRRSTGGLLAVADADGHRALARHHVAAREHARDSRSRTTWTRARSRRASNSTPGTSRRNAVSLSWPRARITVSAASVSNRPVGCG